MPLFCDPVLQPENGFAVVLIALEPLNTQTFCCPLCTERQWLTCHISAFYCVGGTGCCEIWEDLYCQSTYYYTAFSPKWIWSCSLIVTLFVVSRLTSKQLVIDQMVSATISLDGAEYLNCSLWRTANPGARSVEILMGSSKSSEKGKEGKKTCCSSLHSWYLLFALCLEENRILSHCHSSC